MNPRMTKKELGLLKGAIRRVFSRSDLRREAITQARIPNHIDPGRPRVKKWILCQECKVPTPEYLAQADHFHPVIPVNTSLDKMSIDDLVNNIWCDIKDLNILCSLCHNKKTSVENKLRRENKKRTKNE